MAEDAVVDTDTTTTTATTTAATKTDTKVEFKWPDNWRETIAGGDDKELKLLTRYDSPDAVWRKARALEQRISSGELRSALPKDATPEQVAKWREENGIPAKPEEYDIAVQGVEWGDTQKESIARLAAALHGTNATKAQAKAAFEWAAAEIAKAQESISGFDEEARTKAEDALRAEWGNDYRTNRNVIANLLATAPEDVREQFMSGRMPDGTRLENSPGVMKWLAHLARTLNPVGTIVPGAGGDQLQGVEAEIADIEKLMRTDRKAYNRDESKQERYRQLLEARERMKK